MDTRETLHIRLKDYREKEGLSQTEVAKHLGLSRQAISNWESQKSYPDLDNIVLLSKLYEISADELLGTNTQKQISKEENQDTCSISDESQYIFEHVSREEVHTQTEILEKTPQTILEVLCLAVILVLTCQFTIIGMITPILIAVWMKKHRRKYKLIYVLCIVCFLISTQNTFVVIEHAFKLGTTTAEHI